MTDWVVLRARSRWDDGERTRHSGRVRVLKMPFVTTLVFGHVRIFFLSLIKHLTNWDAHYPADITKITEKAGIWRCGPNFVLTVRHEQREGAAPDPEYPGPGAQGDSRVLIPAARVITLKTGLRS